MDQMSQYECRFECPEFINKRSMPIANCFKAPSDILLQFYSVISYGMLRLAWCLFDLCHLQTVGVHFLCGCAYPKVNSLYYDGNIGTGRVDH